MPSYDISGYHTYVTPDSGTTYSTDSAGPITQTGPLSDVDGDSEFDVGEDATGVGNEYLGYIDIGGTFYPILTAADGGVPATNGDVIIFLPASADPSTFPFPANINGSDIITSPLTFCFAAGTMITTSVGDVAVEDLTREHFVLTASGHATPVKWLGRQTLYRTFSPFKALGLVRIQSGAFGEDIPNRDLTVTADHGMVLDGLVINASALVNGSTIDFVPRAEMEESFVVYHVETENHEIVLANGAASETFINIPGRKGFDNCDEYIALYGCERIIPEMRNVRISARRLLPDSIKISLAIEDDAPDWRDFDAA